eukprot:snap_masked-scaffold_5-processed-gene-3.15-mRNA-1 protein AED:1.00 eAED:1.00 QI:0/-1/0/0/-1/1/1/0/70
MSYDPWRIIQDVFEDLEKLLVIYLRKAQNTQVALIESLGEFATVCVFIKLPKSYFITNENSQLGNILTSP